MADELTIGVKIVGDDSDIQKKLSNIEKKTIDLGKNTKNETDKMKTDW